MKIKPKQRQQRPNEPSLCHRRLYLVLGPEHQRPSNTGSPWDCKIDISEQEITEGAKRTGMTRKAFFSAVIDEYLLRDTIRKLKEHGLYDEVTSWRVTLKN